MSTKIHPALFERYVDTLLRFGRAEAPYWFVGLEEGGKYCEAEFSLYLNRWASRGHPDTEFLTSDGITNKESKFLPAPGKRAYLQTTWSNQLRVVLGIEGQKLDNEVIRNMQVSNHGTINGNTSLLELYPLPCSNNSEWVYGDFGLGSEYSNKAAYRKRLINPRLTQIFESVALHKPAAIVFTTWQERRAISKHVSNTKEVNIGTGKVKGNAVIGNLEGTVVVVCSHPASRLSDKNVFYWNLGRAIRELVDESRLPK